ncbi:type IV secretion system protein VirB3 [Luteimonas sp. SDU82]|uniref:type IV secretion system protein VirB3 n=1 Tax=Luteimonas sp. SDU82 TaxID=3422592 RepID=UPI003EBEBD61
MHKDVLFRGCTRPAMFMGVPYMPFAIGAGACLLMTFYFNMFFLALLPVVIFVMRQMARRDEMIFRLLGLRWQFRSKVRNLRHHGGTWAFSQNGYRKDLQDPMQDG